MTIDYLNSLDTPPNQEALLQNYAERIPIENVIASSHQNLENWDRVEDINSPLVQIRKNSSNLFPLGKMRENNEVTYESLPDKYFLLKIDIEVDLELPLSQ